MHIRDAVPDDMPCITAIYADAVLHGTANYEYEPPDAGTMHLRMQEGVAAGFPWLVAIDGHGTVAGYACASAYRTRPGYAWTVEDSIYVASAWRGRGVGRRLLAALIERCTALGFRQMIAVIGDEGNRASVLLHERAGFAVAARFPGMGRKHCRWLTNVQMQRALGDGALSTPFAEPKAPA